MTAPPDHKALQARRRAEREARRKAELKANMARRKAQARGRVVGDDGNTGADQPEQTQD
jgi:hypothetical protein